jgi:ribonuclease BN (tRNA processing enzyme)
MRVTVLGACGAWPAAGEACSGFLVEHEGYRLLLDLGYAVVPRLLKHVEAAQVDAVYITHGHPDHCADLNPLLRARALREDPPAPLDVYAPPGALDAVLALDRPGMLDGAYHLHEFEPGQALRLGPWHAETRLLPHWVPNAAIRLSTKDFTLAYTGDGGPCPDATELARGADLLLAEASYVDEVPQDSHAYLSSARQAGLLAEAAAVGRLLLTHLFPGTDPAAAIAAAAAGFGGEIGVAALRDEQ